MRNASKSASHREHKGVSSDPKARASAARQIRPRSGTVHATDAVQSLKQAKTVSIDLIKPLGDDSWETIGQRLRDLRGCMHRLLNYGVRAAALGDQKAKDVMAAARAGVKQALVDERSYWTDKIGKKYEGSNHDPDRAKRLSELALPSVIEDYVASRAAKAYLDARKHMARGDKSLPSFTKGAPIFFRDGETSWTLKHTESGWEASFKLFAGRSPMVRMAIRVHSASAYADLRRMTAEGVKLGDAKILWHERGGKGQWEGRLCYTYDKPKPVIGSEIVAVHRGMHQFLTIADTRPAVRRLPGDAWIAAKLGLTARRRSFMEHIRRGELGHGARGHGARRLHQAVRRLDDAEARMMRSACQQAAALVADHAIQIGARTVLIEDYSTLREQDTHYVPTWPWAQLKGTIKWSCEKNGLELVEVPAAYISLTCPACEHVSADNVMHGKFECTNCGLDWHIDSIAAFNMLRSVAGAEPVKKMQEKLLRLGKHMRGEQAAE